MEGALESWHQTLPRPSKPAQTDIYNWGDINSLFEDQVQVEKSKVNNLRRLKKPKLKRLSEPKLKRLSEPKLKRLSEPKIGSKRLHRTVPDHKDSGKDMKLTLGKQQKTLLMKVQRGATNTQK